jgi:exosortase B
MPFVANRSGLASLSSGPWFGWLPLIVGVLALYVPTYMDLARGLWQTEEQGHGPLIAAVAGWLIWQTRASLLGAEQRPVIVGGFLMLAVGLLVYVFGRSQDILLFEVGSQIVVLMALLLVAGGKSSLRACWFPLLFLVFMIPLPAAFVDALTNPLKRHVSEIAEHILYATGYPIARSGVTLSIGPYQLLVADACSGLHSMYSLSALGLLYLYLMKHVSFTRNALMAFAILPIAFGANVVRVVFLVLVTYYLGDEAGQGFLHGFAGMVLFVAALGLLFALDASLGLVFRSPRKLEVS